MDLESEEEEEWERELRKAEAIMNLNLNAPPQVGEAENNGSKEDEVVEVDTQGEPVTNPLIGVNKRAYSSRFSASSGRGGSRGQNATGRGQRDWRAIRHPRAGREGDKRQHDPCRHATRGKQTHRTRGKGHRRGAHFGRRKGDPCLSSLRATREE